MDIYMELGTINDIDELEQLYNDVNDYFVSNINYPGWIKGVYPIRQTAIDGINSKHLFVAKYNEKIVGSIILNHKPEMGYSGVTWEYESDYSDVFVIHTLVVSAEYMKCGVGKNLINFALQFGREQNMKSIRLDVSENNSPAISLYEKCGFKYIDTVDLGLGSYGLHWFKLYERLL